MDDTFDRRLQRRSAISRLGTSERPVRPFQQTVDLRVKIPNRASRFDARSLISSRRGPRQDLRQRIQNPKFMAGTNIKRQTKVPFLIPKRTIRNEYFSPNNRRPRKRDPFPSANVATGVPPLMRTISNPAAVQPVIPGLFTNISLPNPSIFQITKPATSSLSPIQGFRVQVKNLQSSVTLEDVFELFSGVGSVRSCNMVRPGFAEVIFNSATDAQSAVAQYNGRELDGRPMLVVLATNVPTVPPLLPPVATNTNIQRPPVKPPTTTTTSMEVDANVIKRALFHSALPAGNPFDETIDIPSSDSEEIPSDTSFSIPSKSTNRRLGMPAGSPGDESELMKAAPDPKLSASMRQIPSPASEDARNGPGGSGGAADRNFRSRSHGKGATSKSKLSNNSANLMGESSEGDDDDDDDEEEDEEDDDDETNTEVIEGMYNPADYEHLIVSAEVKEMFHYIQRYTPQSIDLDTKLRPFIPEYIAAVGDIDAFLKVPRPDGKPDNLGLAVLDEPCANQSDPTVLDLQLRAISKQKTSKEMVVRSLENAEKNTKEIEKWIKSIGELHRSKPPPAVHYVKPMPDVSTLMSEWSGQFEDILRLNILPTAEMDCSLSDYVDTVCAILDIPVYNNRIHSLHLLFSLYMEFKNSQHFRQRRDEKATTDVEGTAAGI